MSSREDILTAVRDRAPAFQEPPPIFDFRSEPGDLVTLFTTALARLDGKIVTAPHPGSGSGWPRPSLKHTASVRQSAL